MFDLEKLKNIDLQNIDLSKIDVNKLLETVLSKKDLFVSVVITVVAILVAIGFTKNFFTETATLNTDINLLKSKIEVIADHDVAQRNIKKFIKSVPQSLDEELLSSTIVDFAAENKLTIVSFVPTPKREEKLFSKISAMVDLEAPNYQSLLGFFDAVSKAPFALRIERCAVSIAQGNRGGMSMGTTDKSNAKKNDTISVNLEISSIEIKK